MRAPILPQRASFSTWEGVIFSHYQYFDELIDSAVGVGDEHWNTMQRISYVWIKNRWVAYRSRTTSALPKEDQITCLEGLVEAKVRCATAQEKPRTSTVDLR